MKPNVFFPLAAAFAAALAWPPAAKAQAREGAVRVDMAGKLGMLSQRVPNALCNLAAGVETKVATDHMRAAAAEFDRVAAALVWGDPGLKITARETDPEVLADVARLQDAWGPIRATVFSLLDREPDYADLASVALASDALLEAAQALAVSVRSDSDNNTPVPQAWALTIDIAGRQRMLAQRMSQFACLLLVGLDADAAATELTRVMETYGTSLWALRFGLKDAGILAPPTEEIGARLEEVAVDWGTLAPILATIRSGGAPDDALRGQLYLGLNSLTGKMNTVVGLYVEASAVSS
ncbi:type IV pili methyl-accepting chemotaxis transducer N-terminal domain-containing protein [Jannaschia seohaensis]|uniref:PilJ/NarX-like methyl-accepting chemotaxis transducer n=1 Tax=Jannaschia seohaensis TaxID=475081 RepID=A0A2Y9B683_9RHOB|nr:type IV pili methyl-accepting chemotaxis transducer N-terminal domain-containing protein [Jannaschia seohaensis]PWJ12507.1 PilJ/NarX-like methyl-accepting chemotaxis transducer [Jannaschia seohaensis]SSA50988.1 Type IV pili methyl-accepting chemotaxis transducer N-term [Jannaschia seohaensis]